MIRNVDKIINMSTGQLAKFLTEVENSKICGEVTSEGKCLLLKYEYSADKDNVSRAEYRDNMCLTCYRNWLVKEVS